MTAVLNHLWQSTLFAAMAGLLTLLLRRNRARTRYWIWLTASVKFLIPFSLLVDAGSHLGWRIAPAFGQSGQSFTMEQVFLAPGAPAAVLLAAWLGGFSIVVFRWWREWRRIRAALRSSTPFHLDTPIQAMSSPALLEPACVIGGEGGAVCRNMTMSAFSNFLTGCMSRVVLDQTGLKEAYDFTLKLESGVPGLNQVYEAMASGTDPGEAKRALAASMRNWASSSVFSDIQKQLGLKLEADKAPVDHLVIDHVEKPSEN